MLIGPKTEAEGGMGTRYHAKERLTQTEETEWYYEERDASLTPTSMLLRNNPIREGDSGWNYVMWIKKGHY